MAATPTRFTIELEEGLARVLVEQTKAAGRSPEGLIADCVAQHLETALRHRVLLERAEATDRHIVAIAEFVEEATAGAEGIDLSRICRYRPEGRPGTETETA